jgi:phosphoglycolate phosphatase
MSNTMKKRDLFIFDLDGTLLNSLIDIAEAVNTVLERWNQPTHPLEAYNYFVGKGIKVLAERALPTTFDKNHFAAFLAEVEVEYAKRQTLKTKPYDGIMDMLKALNSQKVQIAILSNKPDEFTQKVVNHFFSEIEFSIVLGAREQVPRKPDPSAVFEILNFCGVGKDSAAFVGDTATDMHTGNNAGMYSIGVSWGFRKVDELNAAGANAIINHPQELLLNHLVID